ncbi:hypothetical protein A2477_00720 [Candidatus Falkowbacteria bacterium RIFOXYC2_FULL_47_12]|uniref:DUF4325 domain-containing protein n=2 Tax=Candidatus Falkowiibacteriota TaxID=1752728 RepID=A0A1F5TP96_9BACT|nr:MAG: hypothetical protein A2477_00720 [Candidatus Falkowbacteria bacterium RIFOXYC2_FULL_47_12]
MILNFIPMTVALKKFGTTLTSRQSGKEALLAYEPVLKSVVADETIIVDFEGVNTFSPSWGDEFLVPLYRRYGDRLVLQNTSNLSVQATFKILEESNSITFPAA